MIDHVKTNTCPHGHKAIDTTEAHEEALRGYLASMVNLRQGNNRDLRSCGYAYTCAEDFVLQHGVWYRPRKLPKDVPRGAPRQCYANAILTAATRSWRYVEGYAMGVIPVQHAWVLDRKDRLYEVTWSTPGLVYLGVEFSVERADDATWNGDATVLDDFKRRWPLLKTPWTGENPRQQYPVSPWLELIKAGQIKEAYTWVLAHRYDANQE